MVLVIMSRAVNGRQVKFGGCGTEDEMTQCNIPCGAMMQVDGEILGTRVTTT